MEGSTMSGQTVFPCAGCINGCFGGGVVRARKHAPTQAFGCQAADKEYYNFMRSSEVGTLPCGKGKVATIMMPNKDTKTFRASEVRLHD